MRTVASSLAAEAVDTALPRAHPLSIYGTALIEGGSVIIVEIAGARAMAPFFGTSLQVWTAQITVTLLFLALGYGLGGLLAKRTRIWTLPMLFTIAGGWLAAYPLMRTAVLDATSKTLGVAGGSLCSGAILFGPPLLMLGAVSPVLIAYLHRNRPGAGAAAGRLFFINTMGGLAGGWITALALIPHTSLRVSLITTGLVLIALAIAWAMVPRSKTSPAPVALLIMGLAILLFYRPTRTYTSFGDPFRVRYSQQSGIGLLQVIDFSTHRQLLIDGVDQGDMGLDGNVSPRDYIHQLQLLATSHKPDARTALQLGLGAGLLPKALSQQGIKVTAVEIEPQIVSLAREDFDLPADVDVRLGDARAALRHDPAKYDLVLLDTFASESTAWHLLTREAMQSMRDHLNPGGRLLINTVAYADRKLPGLAGIEASVLSVFKQAIVYPQKPTSSDPQELINVIIVAGEELQPHMTLPRGDNSMRLLAELIGDSYAATARVPVPSDDRNQLDYEQAPLRMRWRALIWEALSSDALWD